MNLYIAAGIVGGAVIAMLIEFFFTEPDLPEFID